MHHPARQACKDVFGAHLRGPRGRCQGALGAEELPAAAAARACVSLLALLQRRLLPQAASTTIQGEARRKAGERASRSGGRLEDLGLGRHREAGGSRHLASAAEGEGRAQLRVTEACQQPAAHKTHDTRHTTRLSLPACCSPSAESLAHHLEAFTSQHLTSRDAGLAVWQALSST